MIILKRLVKNFVTVIFEYQLKKKKKTTNERIKKDFEVKSIEAKMTVKKFLL